MVSGKERDEMTGNRRGNTTSLSMSRNDAVEGGGIGIMLRSVPGKSLNKLFRQM